MGNKHIEFVVEGAIVVKNGLDLEVVSAGKKYKDKVYQLSPEEIEKVNKKLSKEKNIDNQEQQKPKTNEEPKQHNDQDKEIGM